MPTATAMTATTMTATATPLIPRDLSLILTKETLTEMHNSGMTVPEIAKRFGVSVSSVNRYTRKYHINWGHPALLKNVSISDLIYMRNHDGLTNTEIAQKLGVRPETIVRHIGKQPKAIRKPRSRKPAKSNIIPMPEPVAIDMTAPASEPVENVMTAFAPAPEPEPLFTYTEKITVFSGKTGSYKVVSNEKTVNATIAGTEINLSFADFCNVAKEISAIAQTITE